MKAESTFNWRELISTRAFIAVILAWTALAVIATTTTFIALRPEGVGAWLNIFRHMLSYYYTWAVFAFCVYGVICHPIYNTLWAWPILLAVLLVFTVVSPFTAQFADWREWLIGSRAVGYHALNISIFIIVFIGGNALKRHQQSLAIERRAIKDRLRANQLSKQLTESRLANLRMQINPHFLFNALNSVGALVETGKNNRAYRALEVLGQLLRSMLDRIDTQYTTVADETRFIQNYIEMEQIRFAEKLQYKSEIADDCKREKIPVSVLQPLVENAIKHAVSPSVAPVNIELRIHKAEDELCIEVIDSGCIKGCRSDSPDNNSDAAAGIGLNNIRDRLTLLYQQNYTLEIDQLPASDGTKVTICLPGNLALHKDNHRRSFHRKI